MSDAKFQFEHLVDTSTLVVALDGRVQRHDSSAHRTVDEDVYSLVVARSRALGLAHLSPSSMSPTRWSHADAGGILDDGGNAGQLGWLQVHVANLPEQRAPVWPAINCLEAVIARYGAFDMDACHALIPLTSHTTRAPVDDLVMNWFEVEEQAEHDVAVTVRASTAVDLEHLALTLSSRGAGLIEQRDTANVVANDADMRMEWMVPEPRTKVILPCRVARWSPDFAAWITEVVVDEAVNRGERGTIRVSVRRADRPVGR